MLKELLKQTNWVDIFVVILLIRGAYTGINKGLFVEVFKFLGLIVAIVVSLHNYKGLAEFVTSHILLPSSASQVLSFIALALGILILFKFLRGIGQHIINIEVISRLERNGGFIVGMIRSVLMASLVIFTLALIPLGNIRASINERSFLGPRLLRLPPAVYNFAIKFYPDQVNPETSG